MQPNMNPAPASFGGGGFGSATPAPAMASFGAGNLSGTTPSAGGFSIGTSDSKKSTTERRRIIKARRPNK